MRCQLARIQLSAVGALAIRLWRRRNRLQDSSPRASAALFQSMLCFLFMSGARKHCMPIVKMQKTPRDINVRNPDLSLSKAYSPFSETHRCCVRYPCFSDCRPEKQPRDIPRAEGTVNHNYDTRRAAFHVSITCNSHMNSEQRVVHISHPTSRRRVKRSLRRGHSSPQLGRVMTPL